jgi:hypothetical protein
MTDDGIFRQGSQPLLQKVGSNTRMRSYMSLDELVREIAVGWVSCLIDGQEFPMGLQGLA